MALASYNGFDSETRLRVGREQEAAFASGFLARPTECKACGQRKGKIIAHLEDYSCMAAFIGVCETCHMAIHCRFKATARWRSYLAAARNGAVFVLFPGWERFKGIWYHYGSDVSVLIESWGHAKEHTVLDEIGNGIHDPRTRRHASA